MAFSHSNHADASGSTFNDVGHDQIFNVGNNINNVRINHAIINISLSLSGQALHHDLPCPTTDPTPRLPESVIPKHHLSAVVSVAINIVVDLIVDVVHLLRIEFSDEYRHLERELKSLSQSLLLTRSAIQVYRYTPLGQSLANTIHPEVERCHVVLQGTLDRIIHYPQSNSTSIGSFWRQVWCSGLDEEELASLRTELSARQESLTKFLMALTSLPWIDLGNELRASHVSIERFSTSLRRCLLPLRHIQINKVLVVDHLGRNLPVPTLFCSTWKDFDYIINGYCHNRVGNRFIKRGDYQVIRAQDSQMIGPSQFASTVEPGMVLEMSIVLRQKIPFQDNKETCPRCGHINLNVTAYNGWIECRHCSGHFQVAKAERKYDKGDEKRGGEANKGGGEEGGEGSNEEPNENREEKEEDDMEEIISPASRTRGSKIRQRVDGEDPRPQDNDNAQFFRRIFVIRDLPLIFNTITLSEGYFTGWNQVNCAAPYNGGRRVVYGTDNGVYISDLQQAKKDPVRVLILSNVLQVDVLEDYHLLVVLSERTVFTIPLDALNPIDPLAGLKRAKKISSPTSFFRYPQDDGAYPGPEQTQFPEIVTRGQHYAQIMDGILHSHRVNIYPLFQDKNVYWMPGRLPDRGSGDFGHPKFVGSRRQVPRICSKEEEISAHGDLSIGNEFLLCYNEFAFYVNKNGWRSRKEFMIHWEGFPTGFALHEPYILAFEPSFVEIRHVETGLMSQIIPSRGSDLRLLFEDRPPSAPGIGSWMYHNSPQVPHQHPRHPLGVGRDEILMVSNGRVLSLWAAGSQGFVSDG